MVTLGDEVKDKVTGFLGIAVARHTYLQGCNRISVQPSVDKDGKNQESCTFDEPQLIVIASQKVVAGDDSGATGGPEKYMPSSRYDG